MEEETPQPERTKVAIIAAIGENRELGRNNELLWHLNEDMQFFKQQTRMHYVIMGRKSFESIPKKYRPLPERVNIIISRDPEYMFEECYTFSNIQDAIEMANVNGEYKAFIIGGGEIYKIAMEANLVDEMFLTHVHASFDDADVFFPAIDESKWKKKLVNSIQSDSLNEFPFDIYHYEKI